MTTTQSDLPGPAPVLGFLVVHAALRNDCAGLAAAAAAGRPVRAGLELFDRVIRAHHHGEDRVLLPLLRSKEPSISVIAERIDAQHAALDGTLDRLRADDAHGHLRVDGVTELAALVEEHLQLEEQELLPIWLASLSAAEHERFARHLRRATPWRDIAVVVPWLLDTVPEPFRPAAEAEMPRPIRFAYRHGLRRRFERRWQRSSPTPVQLQLSALPR